MYDSADYEVNLKFTNLANAPTVASSGAPEPNGDATRYTLTAGRAFVFSMSRDYQVATEPVGDVTVFSYYSPPSKGAGRAALIASAQAIDIYTKRFGPYPHKTLSVVMADFNDGMEYSAFFYLPRDFYNLYDNTIQNYLVFVAAHETAHQWWFEQVGNDQALQPWLDEALATYSERLYYEGLSPDLVPWWWSYRVDFYNPQGFVDILFTMGRVSVPIPTRFISVARTSSKTCALASATRSSSLSSRITLPRRTEKFPPPPISSASCANIPRPIFPT